MIDSFLGPYAFLGNDYPVNVDLDDHTYPSVEHAYQASKTRDPHKRTRIRSAATVDLARQMGAALSLTGDKRNLEVMRRLLLDKFTSYQDLEDKLLATGTTDLINGTWDSRDTFWGVHRGVGENMLGKLLMEIRHDLRFDNATE